jgi:hypothetical protein
MSDLVPAGGSITATSWKPDRELTFEEWEQAGKTLQQIGRAWQWWVGDWINYGEARYGEKYAQAIDLTGLGYEAVANAAWVAGAVEPSTRVETLSWTHHRHVAHLDPLAQREWLGRAAEQSLSTRELRTAIAQDRVLDERVAEGRYRTIVVDHSPSRDQIDIGRIAHPDGAHLYVWTRNQDLPQTLDLIESWGAVYQRTIVPIGKAGVKELVLFCYLGDAWPQEPPTSFQGEGRPEVFYELVEWTSHGPRAGLFFEREGFDG